jgi:hypothetical protein
MHKQIVPAPLVSNKRAWAGRETNIYLMRSYITLLFLQMYAYVRSSRGYVVQYFCSDVFTRVCLVLQTPTV